MTDDNKLNFSATSYSISAVAPRPDQIYRFRPPQFQIDLELAFLPVPSRFQYQPMPPDHIFEALEDGRVITFLHFHRKKKEMVKQPTWWKKSKFLRKVYTASRLQNTVGPGYFFIESVDQAIWRWALENNLQLEDAVRELNRMRKADRL